MNAAVRVGGDEENASRLDADGELGGPVTPFTQVEPTRPGAACLDSVSGEDGETDNELCVLRGDVVAATESEVDSLAIRIAAIFALNNLISTSNGR